jgi:hypothetical protein
MRAPLRAYTSRAARRHTISTDHPYSPVRVTPTIQQQIVRAGFFGVHFTLAYLVMLLAMYYNGYILMVGLRSVRSPTALS